MIKEIVIVRCHFCVAGYLQKLYCGEDDYFDFG